MRLLLALMLALGLLAVPAQAAPVICEKYGTAEAQGYVVQNNVWGASTAQCIDVDQGGGFTVTSAAHTLPPNGAPAAYPSIYAGCHYALCSTVGGLPARADSAGFGNLRTSVSMTYPDSGVWDAAYDIWFDPTPRTDGQNTGAEIMVWLNKRGSIQPVGSQVGTVSLAGGTWQVWFGNIGWNVISYVRTSPASSIGFAIDTFYADAVARGYGQRSWYLTSVQAGFEPWTGGAGLAAHSFTFTSSGGGDTTPPTTPAGLTASGVTATGAVLSWGASSDTGGSGLAGYDVLRALGSGSFAKVAEVSGVSYTDSGLTPSTGYRYQVRARDGAGNVSPVSSAVSVTTLGGGGGCSAAATVQSQWDTGYVVQPATVTNQGTSALSGWTVTFTLPAGHTVTGWWGAALSVSGSTVTARNLSYNGTVPPQGSATFGFQTSRSSGDARVPSGFTCS